MVSFVSAFYHVYILSSLFQPSTTLDITLFFIQQIQRKIIIHKAIISETQSRAQNSNSTTGIKYDAALILQKSGPRVMSQTILHVGSLLLRVFVLLCILLAMSLVDIAQIYYRTIDQPKNKRTTGRKRDDTKENVSSTSSLIILADSPSLLPTPPSEKCDIIPITTLPRNYHAPITKNSDDDTAVKPEHGEPTPPDQKVKSKQQQIMPIGISTNSNNPHYNEKASLSSKPEHFPNDLLAATNTNNQGTAISNTAAVSEPVLAPTNLSTTSPSSTAVMAFQNQSQWPLPTPVQENNDETDVSKPIVLEMLDHAPTPSAALSTHNTNFFTNTQDYERPTMPYLPPLSSSSSLSTLAHTHSHNNQQEKILGPGHQIKNHNSTSRLHQAYTEKQHQQQQHKDTLDHTASSPRAHSSFLTRTHHNETPVITNPSSPQSQGSSLSMKLNKLKTPGRRISQLFKKKNKNKTD